MIAGMIGSVLATNNHRPERTKKHITLDIPGEVSLILL